MQKLSYLFFILLTLSCGRESHEENRNLETIEADNRAYYDSLILEENIPNQEENEMSYYLTGQVKQVIHYNETGTGYSYTEYYKNGKCKVKGEQDNINGCGMAVGDEFHYDSLGVLMQKISYDHIQTESESCHETRTVKTISNFYSNGKIKELHTIETCYECDECPCGEWIFYTIDGEITHTERYGDCYDSLLDCLEN